MNGNVSIRARRGMNNNGKGLQTRCAGPGCYHFVGLRDVSDLPRCPASRRDRRKTDIRWSVHGSD